MEKQQTSFLQLSAGRGRHRVQAALQLMGDDILLSLWGGDQPHIGSVAIAQPRPSLAAPDHRSTTSSVYNFSGHKDEAVSRACAERIAAASNRKTVAVAGIHLQGATPKDIMAILENADKLCGKLIEKLRTLP